VLHPKAVRSQAYHLLLMYAATHDADQSTFPTLSSLVGIDKADFRMIHALDCLAKSVTGR